MREKFRRWLMFSEKGRKFNKFWKKNKRKIAFIGIGTIIFAIVGVVALFVGMYLAGWDIIGWLSSPQAIAIYVILAALIVMLIPLIWAFVNKD